MRGLYIQMIIPLRIMGIALLAFTLLAGCETKTKRTPTLKADINIDDAHEVIKIQNLNKHEWADGTVLIHTRDKKIYSVSFGDKKVPAGEFARIKLASFKEIKTGERFSDWNQFYRMEILTPTERWNSAGSRR
jgi:hypothetical protein